MFEFVLEEGCSPNFLLILVFKVVFLLFQIKWGGGGGVGGCGVGGVVGYPHVTI